MFLEGQGINKQTCPLSFVVNIILKTFNTAWQHVQCNQNVFFGIFEI